MVTYIFSLIWSECGWVVLEIEWHRQMPWLKGVVCYDFRTIRLNVTDNRLLTVLIQKSASVRKLLILNKTTLSLWDSITSPILNRFEWLSFTSSRANFGFFGLDGKRRLMPTELTLPKRMNGTYGNGILLYFTTTHTSRTRTHWPIQKTDASP